MTPAETPAELELLALADPFGAVAQAQSTCILGSPGERPEWRETLLRVLRPWWENASVEEMAWWLDRWAAYEPRDNARPRLRTYVRLGCLVAKCMDLCGDAGAAAELAHLEAWAFGDAPRQKYAPIAYREDNGWSYLRAIYGLAEAIWHPKFMGELVDFFDEAYHASNGEDFAPLIRAAIPLETLVP